jgi:flagellin
LRINQNTAALSAHRNMQVNDANMSKSIERLSSGLRINSAADDAAGLVVSEQLRTQVTGLTVAGKNTQDAVNMIKTTEKALDEITKQLRNIRDLTLHASNNTGNSQALAGDQAQINQATTAIQRISEQTEFAGIKLLSSTGNINNRTFQIGANGNQTSTFSIDAASFDGLGVGSLSADMSASSLAISGTGTKASATGTVKFVAPEAAKNVTLNIGYMNAAGTVDDATATLTSLNAATVADAATVITTTLGLAGGTAANLEAVATDEYGNDAAVTKDYLTVRVKAATAGENSAMSRVTVGSVDTGTGVSGFEAGVSDIGSAGGSIDVESGTADYAALLTQVDTAMKMVTGLRVHLGSFQKNNLESHLSSISVAKENLAASESAIRDTDMAEEMTSFTKSNILMQAGQAMMSQANQAPQGLLQLLK